MSVFISYSSRESDDANLIKSILNKNGIEVWMAPDSIPAGSNYTREIPKAIKLCKVFLLLLSKNAQDSIWVSAEVENAFKNGKIIIPFVLEECPLNDDFDFLLSRSQRIAAYEKKSESLEALVSQIKTVIGIKTEKTETDTTASYSTQNVNTSADEELVKQTIEEQRQKLLNEFKSEFVQNAANKVNTPPSGPVTQVKFTFNNGNTYEGDSVNGERTGKGIYRWTDGTVYEGDFVDGKRTGKGKIIWTDGSFYEGDYVNDKRTGKGKYTWADGSSYEGDFIDDKRTGKGIYLWKDGTVYAGSFVDGKREGKGKIIWTDGSFYEGDYVGGNRTGKGKYTWADGSTYEGDFIDDKRTGKGIYRWKDGTVYEGDFVDSKREGKGKTVWTDGSFYEGDYVDGNRTGKGKYVWN
ncbi:MAG: TIR domain-containing protein, partial [Clostridia bacterium]|nr:TIR domain-containing protein [Clostridia bacterium]